MTGNNRIKNIYYMLSYAYESLFEKDPRHVAVEDFDNIQNLFASIIARGTGTQIKRGLYRDYTSKEEPLSGLRGQVNFSESVKQQTIPQGKIVCIYDEFTENSVHNQILKAVMLMLLRYGDLKDENKKDLRKLLSYLSNVTEIDPVTIHWDGLRYNRNNASYQTLIGICRLAVKGLLLTTEDGKHKLATWFETGEMNRLYEKFVKSYYRRHYSTSFVERPRIKWDVEGNSQPSNMYPDIVLSRGDRQLIIDTKYYTREMDDSRSSRTIFTSNNLYQIYTYVKNSDKWSTGNVAGTLLYAKTDDYIPPGGDYKIGGNIISQKTLDLNQDWKSITKQLETICKWLEQ